MCHMSQKLQGGNTDPPCNGPPSRAGDAKRGMEKEGETYFTGSKATT